MITKFIPILQCEFEHNDNMVAGYPETVRCSRNADVLVYWPLSPEPWACCVEHAMSCRAEVFGTVITDLPEVEDDYEPSVCPNCGNDKHTAAELETCIDSILGPPPFEHHINLGEGLLPFGCTSHEYDIASDLAIEWLVDNDVLDPTTVCDRHGDRNQSTLMVGIILGMRAL